MTTHPHLEGLIPCPFCGGPASMLYDSGNEVRNKSWRVGCTACSIQVTETGSNSWASVKSEDDAAQAKAIERWNRRTALAALPGGGVDDNVANLVSCSAAILHLLDGGLTPYAVKEDLRAALVSFLPTPNPHEADQ